jgi:hypothetical protein
MRWKAYISVIFTILILRFLDLFITFRYTPDLKGEWNPLVSLLGISWVGFLLIQLSIVIFVSFMMFFYFKRKPVIVAQTGLSYYDFIYVYFFGKLRPWPQRMFSFPTNIGRHLVFNGFVFMCIAIVVSVFAIAHNVLLILRNGVYEKFVANYYSIYFPSCFVIITIASVYAFFTIEYVSYTKTKNIGEKGP